MTEKLIYSGDGIEIWQRQERFFIRYDAGAHIVALREDEITSDEVAEAMSGSDNAGCAFQAAEAADRERHRSLQSKRSRFLNVRNGKRTLHPRASSASLSR